MKWKLKDCTNGISPKLQHNSQEKTFIFCAVISDCPGQKAPCSLGWGGTCLAIEGHYVCNSSRRRTGRCPLYIRGHICSSSGGLGTAGLSGLWGESFRMKRGHIERVSSMVCDAVWLRSAKPCSCHVGKNTPNIQVWSTDWRPKRLCIPSGSWAFESPWRSLPLVSSVKFNISTNRLRLTIMVND